MASILKLLPPDMRALYRESAARSKRLAEMKARAQARVRIIWRRTAAERYGVTIGTIYQWEKNGKLPPHDVVMTKSDAAFRANYSNGGRHHLQGGNKVRRG